MDFIAILQTDFQQCLRLSVIMRRNIWSNIYGCKPDVEISFGKLDISDTIIHKFGYDHID